MATDVVGFDEAGNEELPTEQKINKKQKSGGFQQLGLSYPVLKGVMKRGYKVPTPIQRKTLPVALGGRDIVAMARTGSGKTASFLLPMFEKLKEHSNSGIRALILSPTRELSLQTYRFIKELGRFMTLRTILILGGDPMESQFSSIHGNPDIIVATPGRFLHICVEMKLKLNSIEYVVLDEADRLFEMGFSDQLTEILQRLPTDRQTLLFSATLPKVLVQFAKAGLHDPVLIRLDLDSKIPETLELSYFYCRHEEREAALLSLLKHVVKPNSMTVIFAATKHHVDFLHEMLLHEGISNTYVYSDLDATARKINTAKFQTGATNVLVVTDVAARGIDIPQLDYVINFNFPAKPKLFVHRVGRCARAGRKGEALSLIATDELCYLLDLHLFLGRELTLVDENTKVDITNHGYFGKVPQILIEEELTTLTQWLDTSNDARVLKKLCVNGYKNYVKSRPAASKDSVRRSKNVDLEKMRTHPSLTRTFGAESERLAFISKMKNYKPKMTIFELGQSSNSVMSLSSRLFRKINKESMENFHKKRNANERNELSEPSVVSNLEKSAPEDIDNAFEQVITQRKRRKRQPEESQKEKSRKIDTEHYIPYKPSDDNYEKGLAVNDIQAKSADSVFEVMGDTADMVRRQKKVERKWDPMKKKYVTENNKEKMIKSESGGWIPLSYRSGRYEKWQEKNKAMSMQEGNNDENDGQMSRASQGSMRLNTHWGKHNLKMYERERAKPLLDMNLERILKQRKIKEKRKARNQRAKRIKKTKVKKKSAKFNKV